MARQQSAEVFDQIGGLARELGEARAKIRIGQMDAKIDRLAVELDAESDEFETGLEADPDLDKHESKAKRFFDERMARARKEVGPEFHGELDRRVEPIRIRRGSRVRIRVMQRRLEAGRADLQRTAGLLAQQGGRAVSDDDRMTIREQALDALQRGMESGMLGQVEHDRAVLAFDDEMTEAMARAGKNEDPDGTLQDLRERRGGFEHMDESKRQQWVDIMQAEIRQRDGFAKARETEARTQQERAEKELREKTEKDLLFLEAQGALTVDHVWQAREILSADTVKHLLQAATQEKEKDPDAISEEYFRLRALKATDPRAFVDAPIDRSKMTAKRALELLDAQQAIREGKPSSTGESFRDRWTHRVADMEGLDKEEQNELFRRGEERFQAYEQREGKAPGPKEQQEIIDDVLMQETRRPGRFGGRVVGPKLPLVRGVSDAETLLPQDLETLRGGRRAPGTAPAGDEIPAAFLERARASLQRKGQAVTEEAIRQLYVRARQAGLAK